MTSSMSFGQSLREARERRGLSVEQLSEKTTIPVSHIEALECGVMDALPRAMYRRAEARAYAEAVGLDPDVILTQLRQITERKIQPPAEPPLPPVLIPAVLDKGVTDLVVTKKAIPAREVRRQATGVRAIRAVVVLIIGCAALVWEQAEGPSIEMNLASNVQLPALDTESVIDEAIRIAEPPQPPPSLRRVLYEPRIAANGQQWPRDGRLDEGVLVVHSTPRGARVTVNGVGWGVTPVAIRYLPMGTLRVRIGKADYAVSERVVRLTPEAPSTVLRVRLSPLERRRPQEATEPLRNTLVVTTDPAGARVTVNGIGWGTTPLSIQHLPAGTQRIRVVKERFVSEERVISLREGQPGHVSIALKPVS